MKQLFLIKIDFFSEHHKEKAILNGVHLTMLLCSCRSASAKQASMWLLCRRSDLCLSTETPWGKSFDRLTITQVLHWPVVWPSKLLERGAGRLPHEAQYSKVYCAREGRELFFCWEKRCSHSLRAELERVIVGKLAHLWLYVCNAHSVVHQRRCFGLRVRIFAPNLEVPIDY